MHDPRPRPTGIALLDTWTLFRVSGDDAAHFLQSQLTCDVDTLEDGAAVQCAWCSAKGRVIALFHLGRASDGFTLFTASALGDLLLRRLRMYVLRAKVSIEPAGETERVAGLIGEPAADAFPGSRQGFPPPWRFERRDGLDWLGLPGDVPRAIVGGSVLAATPAIDEAAWRAADIAAAIPFIDERTSERFLPQMLNLDLGPGVSFRKGCYPGQEIVARTRYLGRVKQRMARASCRSDPDVVPGMRVVAPGAQTDDAGTVLFAAPVAGGRTEMLVVLRVETAGEALRLGDAGGPALEGIVMPDTDGTRSASG